MIIISPFRLVNNTFFALFSKSVLLNNQFCNTSQKSQVMSDYPSHLEKALLFLGVWLSPNCTLVKMRLIQASLHRLFLLPSCPDSMPKHIFNKNPIPLGGTVYQHMGYRPDNLPILYNGATAQSRVK